MTEGQTLKPPAYTITCDACGQTVPVEPWLWKHSCGGTLSLKVNTDADRIRATWTSHGRLARFAPVLPLRNAPETAAGDTPVLHEDIDGLRVAFKLEYLNPGGSFKDRGAYVAIGRCSELGITSITIDSSGNAGVSMTRTALRNGIGVEVFLPLSTPRGKKALLRMLGAQVQEIAGDRMAVHEAALAAVRDLKAYVGHWYNPYFLEGVKTMGYEAVEQMPHIDFVFCPVGAGTAILGLYKGFAEMAAAGMLPQMPRFVAVQAAGFSPVADALGARASDHSSTLADGIAIASPPRRAQIVDAVRSTGGFGVTVNDSAIRDALRLLISRGYIVEPTSAVPLAGLRQATEKGMVPSGSSILIPLTGTGMKALDELAELVAQEREAGNG
jgi:threonine synthase